MHVPPGDFTGPFSPKHHALSLAWMEKGAKERHNRKSPRGAKRRKMWDEVKAL
jgi:hypothetical protein